MIDVQREQIGLSIKSGYRGLFDALLSAYEQAAEGKGSERHGGDHLSFEAQPIFWIAEEFGDAFLDGQAVKKIHEARSLPPDRAIAELQGAIVYLCVRIMRLSGEVDDG